jgi:hypothetical protein
MKIDSILKPKVAGLFPFFKKLVAATFATNLLFIVEYDFSGSALFGWLSQFTFIASCLCICFFYLVTERLNTVCIDQKLDTLSVRFLKTVDHSLALSIILSATAITCALFSNNAYLGVAWLVCFFLLIVAIAWVRKIETIGEKIELVETKTKLKPTAPPQQAK